LTAAADFRRLCKKVQIYDWMEKKEGRGEFIKPAWRKSKVQRTEQS